MSRSRASTEPRPRRAGGPRPRLRRTGEPGPEDEASLHVAGHQPVVLERHCEAVGGRSGRPCRRPRPARVAGPASRAAEHESGLVEHADARSVVHMPILSSQSGMQDVASTHRIRSRRSSQHGQDPVREGLGRARRPERM